MLLLVFSELEVIGTWRRCVLYSTLAWWIFGNVIMGSKYIYLYILANSPAPYSNDKKKTSKNDTKHKPWAISHATFAWIIAIADELNRVAVARRNDAQMFVGTKCLWVHFWYCVCFLARKVQIAHKYIYIYIRNANKHANFSRVLIALTLRNCMRQRDIATE